MGRPPNNPKDGEMAYSEIGGFSPASAMLRALRDRQVSAVELLGLQLRRIERFNPALNAMVIPDFDHAHQVAAAADQARGRGEDASLLGLPMTVKDCIDVEGLRGTAGVAEFAERRPPRDARIVERVRSAGAVIMGKTNVPPWAGDWQANNPIFGRTNNPWDLARTPGGSTGGGAAALAAGLTPLELGSDIGGSIRVPAAFCGVYGHRPSETAVPRSGHFPGVPSRTRRR
jgi:amidase